MDTDIKSKNFTKDKLLVAAAAVCSFISDILEPIAPFAQYLFFIFSLVVVLLGLSYLLLKKHRSKLSPFFVQSVIITTMTGLLFGLQSFTNSDNGVLAVYIPGIEKMQASLGLIEQDIADIKVDTAAIRKTTTEISGKIDSLGDRLGKQGGIIADPQTAEQWYHNARVYELRGDFGNARRSYAKYFLFDGTFIDPHIRFQTFLKIQEGRAGARELYNEMFSVTNNNPVVSYAKLLLNDNANKRKSIAAYINSHADFAPAYYELSRLYSSNIVGEQTLADKKNERENLGKFLELNKKGKLIRYFIDKNTAAKWIEDASSRYASLEDINKDIFVNPITVNAMKSNPGWSIVINVAEKPFEVFYRLQGQAEFTSLGMRTFLDPLTKKPYPNTVLSAPDLKAEQKIEIKYRDSQGNIKGPFDYMFYPQKELAKYNAGILKQTATSWLSFRRYNGLRVDFGHLYGWRCGITTVKYGIDKTIPDTVYSMPQCNIENAYARPKGTVTYFVLPQNTKMMSIQIDYATGEQSRIYKFNVPAT